MELPLTPLDLLARIRRSAPDRVGVIEGEASWTYRDLGERCDRLGHALQQDIGLRPGQVVAWLGGNTHELLEAYYRSEEHTSELQSLMRISYAVFCLKKKKNERKTIRHS